MSFVLCLDQFESIVRCQESFCHVNDKIYTSSDNINLKNVATLDNYPKEVSNDVLQYYQNTDETQLHFQDYDEVLLKRLIHVYLDQGISECFNVAANQYEISNDYKFITLPAFYIRKSLQWFQNLQYQLQPRLKELHSNYTSYLSTRNWQNSEIRYVSWHPLCLRLAVATFDDTVNVFHCIQNIPVTILRGRIQKSISCLSWRPYAPFELAVGTSTGVVLWKIDPNSVQCRPSVSNATVLGQSNITNMTWNNWGTLLITASSFCGSISIWNCEQNKYEQVWCSKVGVNLITWAMSTHYLFSSGIEGTYKVWDSCNWTFTKWNLERGIIHTACWTPCGNHLIFATSEDPNVFTINMNVALSPTRSSTPLMGPTCLIDTTRISLPSGDCCGGLVQNLQLSSNGSHLAVMFNTTNYIAVCKINSTCAVLHILPCFLFCGILDEEPACMDFQKNHKEGSVLTVAWSSARIQHIPII